MPRWRRSSAAGPSPAGSSAEPAARSWQSHQPPTGPSSVSRVGRPNAAGTLFRRRAGAGRTREPVADNLRRNAGDHLSLAVRDGVPPSGVGDQGAGIRRWGTVAQSGRVFNSPQQGASWTPASAEIVRSLVAERVMDSKQAWPWASASTAAPPPRPALSVATHALHPPTTWRSADDPFAANFRTLPKIRAALVALAHGSLSRTAARLLTAIRRCAHERGYY
jgi:hypothetical protein